MTDDLESTVARHYGRVNLTGRILDALGEAGVDTGHLTAGDLATVDEFHIGGRQASEHVLGKLVLERAHHVLDVGCGIGGTSRYIAETYGCRVTGIDLTPEFIDTARALTELTGLADKVDVEVASALDLPFEDGRFDVAVTVHVAMNIKDRPRLYGEVARVLKPRAQFCVYDVMRGATGEVRYPTPWAETPASSHVTTPAEMRELLDGAGFDVEGEEDLTEQGIAFFRERLLAAPGPGPALGPQLLLGASARTMFENVATGLVEGALAPVVMLARRRA